MGGPLINKNVGNLTPVFAAGTPFRLEVNPPAGVLKSITFGTDGQHTTNITTGQIDGEQNKFAALQITCNRKNRPPIIHNALPRDHKYITAYMEGEIPACANPATAGTAVANAHFGSFNAYFAPSKARCKNPDDWGLATSELAGPIIIEGLYGAVTDIGTGCTAITDKTFVTCNVEKSNDKPGLVLNAISNRLANVTADRLVDQLSHGSSELLAGVFYRQHDNSALAAQRVPGLITRLILEHPTLGVLHDDLYVALAKRGFNWAGMSAAEAIVAVGTGLYLPSEEFYYPEMPILGTGRQLTLVHDGLEATPEEVLNVAPAASDAVYAVVLGAQLSAEAAAKFGI